MTSEPFDQGISEAAAFFGVHVRTVQKWATDGELKGTRTPGGVWRFRQSALDQLAAKRMNSPQAATA